MLFPPGLSPAWPTAMLLPGLPSPVPPLLLLLDPPLLLLLEPPLELELEPPLLLLELAPLSSTDRRAV